MLDPAHGRLEDRLLAGDVQLVRAHNVEQLVGAQTQEFVRFGHLAKVMMNVLVGGGHQMRTGQGIGKLPDAQHVVGIKSAERERTTEFNFNEMRD